MVRGILASFKVTLQCIPNGAHHIMGALRSSGPRLGVAWGVWEKSCQAWHYPYLCWRCTAAAFAAAFGR